MSRSVEHLLFDFTISGGRGKVLNLGVEYTPVVEEEGARLDLSDHFILPDLLHSLGFAATGQDREAYGNLAARCERFLESFDATLHDEELSIDGEPVKVQRFVSEIRVATEVDRVRLEIRPRTGGISVSQVSDFSEWPATRQRLLESIITSVQSFCWRHLRNKFAVPGAARTREKVFISYRQGHQDFAETLAKRLGQEGFIPWFDGWEVLAGDSVPGKIAEGLRDSVAFLPIITADYEHGKWATEELETAISKRIEVGYSIIPVLLENAPKPELIRHLRHVDFTDQDPETFESKIAEIIDGINHLSLNPFR
jgi:hypothetical protein